MGSSVRLTTGDKTPAAAAAPAEQKPIESTGAPKTKTASPIAQDALEISKVADLDTENRKKHMERIRDSADLSALLKSAKTAYAGAAVLEPEHLALQLFKDLKMSFGPDVEADLMKSAKTNAQADAKGMSDRATNALLATSIHAGDATPTLQHLLAVLKKIAEPYAGRIQEIAANHKLETLLAAESKDKVKDLNVLKKLQAQTPTINSLGEDLVMKAAEKRIDRAVGRNDEIEQILVSLGKRQLNSLVLTGEAGVGKTAIVEGLALMIANGEVPGNFKDARIINVSADKLKKAVAPSPASAVATRAGCRGPSCGAGGAAGGAGGDVVEGIAAEVAQAEKMGTPIILFIDEIHQLMSGAGTLNDLADRLKPYLSRGALRMIGATTNAEYRKSIAKDEALKDRFPEFRVSVPSKEAAVQMVLANLDKFAEFHGVEIDASAAQSAVDLSHYNSETENPRAAINWLDQAASAVAFQLGTKPPEIRILENEIKDVKIAIEQAKGDGSVDDADSDRTRGKLTKRLDELTDKLEKLVQHGEKEKKILDQLQTLGGQLRAAVEADASNPEEVTKLRADIAKARKELSLLPKRIYHLRVDGGAVAAAVSKATGIDLQKIQGADAEKYTNVVARLSEKVIGQDHVKAALAEDIKLDRAKLRDPKRPLGVHLFAGPTGVGKTEMAKALASEYFGGNLIRFDCNEMMEKHELAKLKGAPPGYVGFEGGSSLAEEIRKKGGRAVLLFDEIEKAHPDILQLLMQIMDEGRFRDNENREVDCTNVEIVFTSNLGSDTFAMYAGDGAYTNPSAVKQGFQDALAGWAKPEVRNRFTGIHVFNPLGKKDMEKILDVRLKELKQQLENTHGVQLGATQAAKTQVIDAGFSPVYGGRALNREVSQRVRVPLAESLIQQRFTDGAYVMVDVDPKKPDALTFRPMTPDEKLAVQADLEKQKAAKEKKPD